ncbi:MAG: pilus assembly protein PilM [Deltaproteobacteria bacterium]|nr:pilus assembly protein PilM [Deltaproteobacteria bacterium]
MAKKYTGIEITATAIRTVQLSASGNDLKILSFEEFPLRGKKAGEVLSELANEKKFSEGAFCSGISAHKVFFREASFPFDDKKKIFQALPFTLADTLPFPLKEASYSSYPLKTEKGKTTVKSLVARKDSVNEAEALFSPHLPLSVITAENSALAAPFTPSHGEASQCCMTIHISGDHSILSIIREGDPLFSRTLTKGMETILSDLRAGADLSENEALELLCSGRTSLEEEKVKSAEKSVKNFFNTFIREMELSIRSFGLGKEVISSLMITGAGSEIKGIASYLEEKIDIKVSPPQLKEGISLDPGVRLNDLIVKGTAALGYALIATKSDSINFISKKRWLLESNLYKSLYTKRKMLALGAGILLVLYTINLAISVTYHKKRYLSLKENVRDTFLETLPETKRIQNEEHQLKTALTELEYRVTLLSAGGNMKVVDMLREITTRGPDETTFRITRMRIDDKEIKLEGETAAFEKVEKIKSALGTSPLFDSVEVGGAKASRLQNIVEFQLNIKLAR